MSVGLHKLIFSSQMAAAKSNYNYRYIHSVSQQKRIQNLIHPNPMGPSLYRQVPPPQEWDEAVTRECTMCYAVDPSTF